MDGQMQMSIASLSEIGNQIRGTKYATLGVFACMVYDHILTLPEEIEHMWKRKFSLFTMLFIMTRYYSLLVLSVILAGFFSPLFTPDMYVYSAKNNRRNHLETAKLTKKNSSCTRYVPFLPFAGGLPLTIFPDMVMATRVRLKRVYALYMRSRIVGTLLVLYLLAEFSVAMWIYCSPGSHPLRVPAEVVGLDVFIICIDIIAEGLGNTRSAMFQFMQTIFDTIVFVMIIYRTATLAMNSRRAGNRGTNRMQDVLSVIASQGLVYFGVIFSSNFLWAMMIIFAPEGLKYATATATLTLNCVMANRITLGLRSLGGTPDLPVDENVPRHITRRSPLADRKPKSSLKTLLFAPPRTKGSNNSFESEFELGVLRRRDDV